MVLDSDDPLGIDAEPHWFVICVCGTPQLKYECIIPADALSFYVSFRTQLVQQ